MSGHCVVGESAHAFLSGCRPATALHPFDCLLAGVVACSPPGCAGGVCMSQLVVVLHI